MFDMDEDRSECEDRLSMNRDQSKERPLRFSGGGEPESSDKKEKKRSDVCEEQPERSRSRAAPRYRRIEQGQGEIPEEPHNGRRHMQSRGRRSSKRSSYLPALKSNPSLLKEVHLHFNQLQDPDV